MNKYKNIQNSQNFIKRNIIKNLLQLENININKNDIVIEIGGGKGSITSELLPLVKNLIVIEDDQSLAKKLKDDFKNINNINIYNMDIFKYPLPKYKYKVISNIPFNITSDIINYLTNTNNKADEIYLIMQYEAAQRFMGKPLNHDSQISILLKVNFEITYLTKISRHSFFPEPRVDTAFIKFKLLKNPLINSDEYQVFRDFVIYGYNQYGKSVLDSFKKIFTNSQKQKIEQELKIKNLKLTEISI